MAYGDYGSFVYLNGKRRADKEDALKAIDCIKSAAGVWDIVGRKREDG